MSFQKLIAAVDSSPAGVHALRASVQLASAAGSEVTVLRVVENPWSWVDPGQVEGQRRASPASFADHAADVITRELEELMRTAGAGAVQAQARVRFGLPSVEIARWAEIDRADLIVLGRQPVGSFERRPAGRTLEGTLRRAGVPCLVVPFGQRTWRRVLAAVSDGPDATDVQQTAHAFAAIINGEVTALHVERPEPSGLSAAVAGSEAGLMGRASAVACYTMVRQGDPAGEILKLAREEVSDVIVVGYHRGDARSGGGASSVAHRVLQRAPCAILTVPV